MRDELERFRGAGSGEGEGKYIVAIVFGLVVRGDEDKTVCMHESKRRQADGWVLPLACGVRR